MLEIKYRYSEKDDFVEVKKEEISEIDFSKQIQLYYENDISILQTTFMLYSENQIKKEISFFVLIKD